MRIVLPGLPGDQNSSIRYGTASLSATVAVTATPTIINSTPAVPAEPDSPDTGDGPWDPDKDPADPRHEVLQPA